MPDPIAHATSAAPTRSRGRTALAVVFLLLSLNALAQVALALVGRASDPGPLRALQACVGAAALAAAWGTWTRARWAPLASVAYGLVTAGMLVSLESILALGREARTGLWVGAAAVLLFALGAAHWLRRRARD